MLSASQALAAACDTEQEDAAITALIEDLRKAERKLEDKKYQDEDKAYWENFHEESFSELL